MTTVLAVHSHGGGTGKSNFAVNLATVLATGGRKVCLVDTDVQAPGLHVLLGIAEENMPFTLSDYLVGRCEIERAAYDITDRLIPAATGRLMVVPSRLDADVIAQIIGHGYDAGLLDDALDVLARRFEPDVLILDTHAGMTNETMVALAAADAVVVVVHADEQDYRRAAVTTAVFRRLNCPRMLLVMNMVAAGQDIDAVRELAEAAYGSTVVAVIPYSTEIAQLAGTNVFALEHPDHAITEDYVNIAELLLDDTAHPTSPSTPTVEPTAPTGGPR